MPHLKMIRYGYKNAKYIKADYIKDDFIKQLALEGIDFDAPSLIIWEGNWMYLENDEVEYALNTLKQSFKQFIITFDYCSQALVDKVNTLRPLWQGNKKGLEDIHYFAKQHGFAVINNNKAEALAKIYKVENNPPEEFSQYSVCSLRKL